LSLNPGLIGINGPVRMNLELQVALFEKVLDKLDVDSDMTNQVMEVNCGTDGISVEVVRYKLPKE
jgi:hypothetical protein